MQITSIYYTNSTTLFSLLKGINGNENGYDYEFVFGIPEVKTLDNPHVMISTTSSNPIHATVTIPGTEFEVNKTLVRGAYVDVALPGSVYLRGTGVQSNKTVVVRASGKVSVHVMANEGKSYGDGFLVLPTKQLGTDHYVLSYTPTSMNGGVYYHSFICVSALSGNSTTNVEIKTKTGTGQIEVELHPYESFQLVSRYSREDFSGSRIISSNPVTVIAGTECSSVGYTGRECNALVELMPPLTHWGSRVVLSPFSGSDNGYWYRILGTNEITKAAITNIGVATLAEGQWYEGNVRGNTMVTIKADNPILVMQYIQSGHYRSPFGDPSMIIAPSTNMYTNNRIEFPVFDTTFSMYIYYINVITDCNEVHGLTYDNYFSMASWERLTPDDGEMCSVRGNVSAGEVHTISHEDGNVNFTVAVYGQESIYADSASFAYLADIKFSGKNCNISL